MVSFKHDAYIKNNIKNNIKYTLKEVSFLDTKLSQEVFGNLLKFCKLFIWKPQGHINIYHARKTSSWTRNY